MSGAHETGRYRIAIGDGRSTEALVAAGAYGYAHSCVTSDNFPARVTGRAGVRDIVVLRFDGPVAAPEVLDEARTLGLNRSTYEEALYLGAQHPDAQRGGPVVFL